ncbi:protein translocase subunit SecDF [Gimesia maris]|uniref:Multifunctional fusion protein n=1 Tax=Gimesia maris TaxID=122 RepID=A0ABX5YLV6_9PLAN|nr:protein translocase subunit SecDF [Gimesia maris]EDL57664.1 protein-export membrane protein secD [Gimesia maris DSM 8797]MAC52641.1 protein translocase subunit SecDF [Gimesia sp.]QDT79138.1 bifunctional preprotein translocase subunit SecD/SecF [Gimesia maris]QEG16654.1 bifunctional preprotein translocase subunit SecD/SecF [Gimesia maris]|tara:strand:- start:49880 stop:52855 length:2976 start_codon:yes stop_codon:yes gene_type:complete
MTGIEFHSAGLFAAEVTEKAPSSISGWSIIAIILAVFVVPFVLGVVIARALKMKDYGKKIGLVLFTAVIAATPFVWQVTHGHDWRDAIRLGIDLAGGSNMVFEVDESQSEKELSNEVMDQMVGAIGRRINPSGTEEVTVRKVGQNRIEVIVPGADSEDVQRIKSLITRLGSLEFAIVANRRDRDHADEVARALENPEKKDIRDKEGRVVASWREVKGDDKYEGVDQIVARPVTREDGTQGEEVLILIEPNEDRRVTGKYLVRASQTTDQNGGPAVRFVFNAKGGSLFGTLTSKNRPSKDGFERHLAVLLDGKVQSAPSIRDTISTEGIISGRFTQKEVNELLNVLNAGALEVPLKPEPVSEFSISPLLGSDVQEKGKQAILIAACAVIIFMLIYYRFAGVVANICLTLNLLLVMGCMSFIDATFTLPGLAGLVLTIGMAVDANVLIFERIREEKARGSSLRMAINNGFSRAFTTIVDANLTTLIVAVVLYIIGTDQVRGFAVTLFIGIVMSMFTALYVGRLFFDIFERKRWITDLKMMSIVGTTNLDFIGKKMIAAFFSGALIVIGLIVVVTRGQENLDIDFTGGTMVTFEFEDKQEIDDVRGLLQGPFGNSLTIEQLQLSNDPASEGRFFRLRTTLNDADAGDTKTTATNTIRGKLNEAFGDAAHKLRKVTMEYGDVKKLTGSEDSPGGTEVSLTFSGEVKTSTVDNYLKEAIAGITNADGSDKYDRIPEFQLQGVADSKEEEADKRFKKMTMQAGPDLLEDDLKTALAAMQDVMATTAILDEVNSFDSSVASEMQESALLAMLISLIAIVAYIWFRFQRITFGLAAVAALVHDVLVVLGMVALGAYLSDTALGPILGLNDFKINLPMIAAFLTIVGYSLNDTIVVFDRIREVRGKNPALTTSMVNDSLNQTLSRTLLTSITTLIVVLILYAIGGEGIHGFAYCLVLGVIVGTYSSIFIASPVLIWLMNRPGSATARATEQSQKRASVSN